MKNLLLLGFLWGATHLFAQSVSPFIHLDQFGYLPDRSKVAVISSPITGYNNASSYTPSDSLHVVRAVDDIPVHSAAISAWNSGAEHAQSGDKGWWGDFSAFTTEGEYYLLDPATGERSGNFVISDTVYASVLKVAGRMFYYNRCNTDKPAAFAGDWSDGTNFVGALQDTECRYIYDQENAGLEKDLSGGWFDAGDYNKYVSFTHTTLHDLLSAYEENPNAFFDNWDIPESGNGIPDILDEIKWELDWLLKMANADGSVHIKVGSRNFSENTSTPPSLNSDGRYYGPTCSSASITVASVLAHAAKVYGQIASYTGYAQQLEQTAISCFAYSQPFVDNNTFETDCDDGSIIAGDADQNADQQLASFLTAAIYLYELTGDNTYHTYVINRVGELEQLSTPFWGPYFTPVNDALLLYTQLSSANPITRTDILDALSQEALNNYNGYFGFNEDDLYRAFIPNWSYHWGSNQAKASYGLLNKLVSVSGIAANVQSYEQYVDEYIHYFHGVNPQGMVYLSNMYAYGAERSANEIYHTWFADGSVYDHALNSSVGPAPGYVVGGPNQNFTVASLSPPYGQPMQKSYLDFNTSWPDNSWEITEPAIYYQAAYLRLLANRTKIPEEQPVSIIQASTDRLHLYPNPTRHSLYLDVSESISSIEIWSMEGKQVITQSGANNTVDVSGLSRGLYTIRVNGKYVERFRKE